MTLLLTMGPASPQHRAGSLWPPWAGEEWKLEHDLSGVRQLVTVSP